MVENPKIEDELPENYRVDIGDCPGGPMERWDVEVDEPEKGHCFDEMWGLK